MNKIRKFLPGFALVLSIAMAGIAAAQNPAPANAGTRTDSCCCASSGSCGDSCDMKQKDAMKNHVASAGKDGCCCGGDSCDMKKKNALKHHVTASDRSDCCACCGDSCDMKQKDAMKNHATSSDKHGCSCCGDSCDMKNMKDMKKS